MKIIITGGAGFIGCNAASRYLRQGHEVVVIDNLGRNGTPANLGWLESQGKLHFYRQDIADGAAVGKILSAHQDAAAVLHLAAQVAVTTSVANPLADFSSNALGTINVLEAVRRYAPSAAFIFSSTNKVYGGMEEAETVLAETRYTYKDLPQGISETWPLDFHSPYGCSKGAADQYVRDYARIYGMKTVVLRQSCIYGYRQFGIEDQGWIAWFIIAAQLNRPFTIYGDGRQVRDVLFIDDLLDVFDAVIARMDSCAGRIYNIGGGPNNTLSLLELVSQLQKLLGKSLNPPHADWRPGDQRVYVSDIRRAQQDLGWTPRIGVNEGVKLLHRWVNENQNLFA